MTTMFNVLRKGTKEQIAKLLTSEWFSDAELRAIANSGDDSFDKELCTKNYINLIKRPLPYKVLQEIGIEE